MTASVPVVLLWTRPVTQTLSDDVPEHVKVNWPAGPTSRDVFSQETAMAHFSVETIILVQEATYRPLMLQICPIGQ